MTGALQTGVTWEACKSIDAVVERLRELDAKMTADGAADDERLIAWGVDPLYFEGERMYASHLDQVSETRPIFAYHASGHLATVNSALMREADITADTPTPGVAKYPNGEPNGELQEPAAMQLASGAFGELIAALRTPEALWNWAYEARNSGITMVTDLGSGPLEAASMDMFRAATDDPDYPLRVMIAASPSFEGGSTDPAALAEAAAAMVDQGTDKLHFGVVKLVLDGSIQGFTARISWPHYYDPPEGHPGNGLWLMPPDQMADVVSLYHQAGLTVHCHCNGDEASEVFIDAVEQALERHPCFDVRHTVQHCQLTTKPQYKRMAALGMCANIFSNHIFY